MREIRKIRSDVVTVVDGVPVVDTVTDTVWVNRPMSENEAAAALARAEEK